jgi:microcystin-dependent protein
MTYLKKTIYSALPALALAVACMAVPDRAQAAANPYIGEIAAMGIVNFCPRGWASAEGQLLPINQNQSLFSLLGTTYGGDGRTTFGLPDLRGRDPIGVGSGLGLDPRSWGQKGGREQTNLSTAQLASHNHAVNANNLDGSWPGPGDKLLAAAPPGGTGSETIYSDQMSNVQMSSQMIAPTGSSAAVDVLDPTLVIRYCIALVGVYPSRQ